MKTNSLLLYIPGYPFQPEVLLPDRQLAAVAGCLLDCGHTTEIRDFGTLELMDRAFPQETRTSAQRIVDRFLTETPMSPSEALSILWKVRKTDQLFRDVQEEVYMEIAQELAAIERLDFIGFKLNDSDDFLVAAGVAQRFRGQQPNTTIMAMGPFADLFGEAIMEYTSAFDCICAGDVEATVVEVAERLDNREAWGKVSDLVYKTNNRIYRTPRQGSVDLATLAPPAYEPEIYPALDGPAKLKLFEVEDSRGCACRCYACPGNRNGASDGLRMKPVNSIYNELWRLGVLYGARAFHFSGAATPASHANALAHELVTRGLDLTYSRAAHIRYTDPAIFSSLKASGCQVLSFQIDTGSQRLLDGHYGRGLTVTHIEESLRASRAADLFTLTRFTYPAPGDNHHTRAETLRLIDRTRPDAALVGLPEALPGSAWFTWQRAFGFGFDLQSYFRQSLSNRTKFPVPRHRWRILPHLLGALSPSQAIRANEEMTEEIEKRGIPTYCSEATALLAHICDNEHAARQFGKQVLHELLCGDVQACADIVGRFNDAACATPQVPFAARPFVPMRDAVGN